MDVRRSLYLLVSGAIGWPSNLTSFTSPPTTPPGTPPSTLPGTPTRSSPVTSATTEVANAPSSANRTAGVVSDGSRDDRGSSSSASATSSLSCAHWLYGVGRSYLHQVGGQDVVLQATMGLHCAAASGGGEHEPAPHRKFRRVSDDTLEYYVTVNDPTVDASGARFHAWRLRPALGSSARSAVG